MKIDRKSSGFTVLEVLLSAFIMIGLISGAFIVFGSLSEKSDLLLGDVELRDRVRQIEEMLRRDIERAVPTAELEWYSERDGIPGPRFNPEPFADFGSDGLPNPAEPGYNPDLGGCTVPPGTAMVIDPHCDDYIVPYCQTFAPPAVYNPGTCPWTCLGVIVKNDCSEGNGLLDPGEWLIDMDGNGRYTGELFWDFVGFDQFGNATVPLNYAWGYTPTLSSPGPGLGLAFNREADFFDVDGDGVFSPWDDFLNDGTTLRTDPTPPEDNPLTFTVDESYAAIDGTKRFRLDTVGWPNRALAYRHFERSLQSISPFNFIDRPATNFAYGFPTIPAVSTNGIFDPFEMAVYDYFGGVVNAGDQDTLYLRTFVEVGGEMIAANVYYRLIFRNLNRNYAETFDDTVGYTVNTTPPPPTNLGINDGIWTPGEPIQDALGASTDVNANGVCDAIVDPGERVLQRVVMFPGNPQPVIQELGPAVRFNIEYFDPGRGRFVAPFSDSGVDGLFDGEELGFNPNCPDAGGDTFFPALTDLLYDPLTAPSNANAAATERNGVLDTTNFTGLPAGTLTRNPYLQGALAGSAIPYPLFGAPFPFPSGAPTTPPPLGSFGPGENALEGIQRFGYPDSAGTMVRMNQSRIYPYNAREQLPVLAHLDWVAMEPLINQPGANYNLLFEVPVRICDTNVAGFFPPACAGCAPPGNPNGYADYQFTASGLADGQDYRFSPGAVFDEDGWLRCNGVQDSFAFLKPGDQVFVWAVWIPPQAGAENSGSEAVRVPVPPGYYPLVEKKGNRLRLDLSRVPGGVPTPEMLRFVPAVYRAPYLPPAMRIDFALEGKGSGVYFRDLRVVSLVGTGFGTAGKGSQGTPPSIPIRGTVFTVQPGQGSGTGAKRPGGNFLYQ